MNLQWAGSDEPSAAQSPLNSRLLNSCLFKSSTLENAALFEMFWPLMFTQSHTRVAAVLVDEFDAGHLQGTPILAADKWISDLQFFDYLSLLQVFRIGNGTSCAHGCRDDQSIID